MKSDALSPNEFHPGTGAPHALLGHHVLSVAARLRSHFLPIVLDRGTALRYLDSNNFDGLRLVLALMVAAYHVGTLSRSASLAWLNLISAPFAVQAFFVISGFLVTLSFERSSSLFVYAEKRFRRIVPAYVAVVAGCAVVLSLVSTWPLAAYFSSSEWRRYLTFNLAFLNFLAPSLPGVFQQNPESAVNGSLWTIKIELAFYCFVPLLVWAMRRFGSARVLGILFLASVAWRAAFGVLSEFDNSPILGKLAHQFPGQLCFFVAGAGAYRLARSGYLAPAGWGLLGALAYVTTAGWAHDLIAPVAVTAVVYWAALAAPHMPPLREYGDFSYGIYLYHFPIIQAFAAAGAFAAAPVAATVTVSLAVGAAGFVSWHLVERPALTRRTCER